MASPKFSERSGSDELLNINEHDHRSFISPNVRWRNREVSHLRGICLLGVVFIFLTTLIIFFSAISLLASSNLTHYSERDHHHSEKAPLQILNLELVELNHRVGSFEMKWYEFRGNGPAWKNISGTPAYHIGASEYAVLLKNLQQLNETSVHAHGLNPPQGLDGVPYISDIPLGPGASRLIQYSLKSPISHTAFLHSHYFDQGPQGAALPIITEAEIPEEYPLREELQNSQQSLMFLQDFCPHYTGDKVAPFDFSGETLCNTEDVFNSLKHTEMSSMDMQMCMPFLDVHVTYSHMLCNGKTIDNAIWQSVNSKSPVRLRIVNAAGMSNFNIFFSGIEVDIIALDGHLVHPYRARTVWVAVGQRVDVLIGSLTGAVPILAIVEGAALRKDSEQTSILSNTITAALVLDSGVQGAGDIEALIQRIPEEMRPVKPEMMTMNLEKSVRTFQEHIENDANGYIVSSDERADRSFDLILTGMHGFKSMNGNSFLFYPMNRPFQPNTHPLQVVLGEHVRIYIENKSMHPHSMHLHGHVFRVTYVNGTKIASGGILRDTFLIPACQSAVIEFRANNPGIWPFHCHMEFHMLAGMATTIEYISS